MHIHSIYSDGSLSPEDVLKLAAQKGLNGVSITDHDTIAAYPEAEKWAEETGVRLVTGVEFSCYFEGINVHVLGYNFSLEGTEIPKLCKRHTKRREERNRAIIEKLKEQHIHIEERELKGHQVGRPHIAEVLARKGYVRDIKEAFSWYLGEGKKGYVQGETFSVEETIGVIHADGGKAFLAHPHLLPKRKLWVKKLLQHPFDGIECYYARIPLDEEKRWIALAEAKGVLISGGSDYHGAYKPSNILGSSWIDEERFNLIAN